MLSLLQWMKMNEYELKWIIKDKSGQTDENTKRQKTMYCVYTRGDNRLHSQPPSECDYLLRLLDFYGDYFVISEPCKYFLASLQNLENCGLQQSSPSSGASFFLYMQTIINWKCLVCQSITCSAQHQVHLLPQNSHQTRRSPPGSFWAWKAAPVLTSGSNFLRILEYYFLHRSEYQFLVCRLYGNYPAKECHH